MSKEAVDRIVDTYEKTRPKREVCRWFFYWIYN